jgi:hypothetical protein
VYWVDIVRKRPNITQKITKKHQFLPKNDRKRTKCHTFWAIFRRLKDVIYRKKWVGMLRIHHFEVFDNFIENPSGGRPLTEYALSISCGNTTFF